MFSTSQRRPGTARKRPAVAFASHLLSLLLLPLIFLSSLPPGASAALTNPHRAFDSPLRLEGTAANPPETGPHLTRFTCRNSAETPDLSHGLYYLRARYMNTANGRFWNADSYEGKNRDPHSLHKYLYVHSNPTNCIDPSGHISLVELSWSAGISATLSIISNLATGERRPGKIITDALIAGTVAVLIGPLASKFSGFIDTVTKISGDFVPVIARTLASGTLTFVGDLVTQSKDELLFEGQTVSLARAERAMLIAMAFTSFGEIFVKGDKFVGRDEWDERIFDAKWDALATFVGLTADQIYDKLKEALQNTGNTAQ